ncbi:MAG TPA: DNA recombination protein RmuC [Acidimicrobiales bacterium]|nr:DNA recombination protein RmuC [Acidimicrobiales bacterium]
MAGLIVGLVVGGAVAALVTWALSRARSAAQQAEHGRALESARGEVERLEVALDQERAAAHERQAAADEVRRQLTGEFATLSRQALEHNNAQFIALADARLREAQATATGDLDQRKQAIEQLLVPLRDQLGRYEQGLRVMELERQQAYAGLTEQVKQLSQSHDRLESETRNLVTALRAPATRGRWGELQLRRVVEIAGMLEHCDFEEQVHVVGPEGRMRPDMVVHLPGGREVVVDAKVPLQAFLDASDASDEDSRRTHLQAHARQLRHHVDALSKKAYWEQFDHSPDYVVAFVPGDPLLAAALEFDPTLLEHAVGNRVLLATPTNLIALLRTVAYSWQNEALADNAREVQQLGRELYKRLATFGEHLARTGRSLNGAVEAFNKAVGSLERTVLPQARRFEELGVGCADRKLPDLDPVGSTARPVQGAELSGPRGGEFALELIEGTGDRVPELPDAAAT